MWICKSLFCLLVLGITDGLLAQDTVRTYYDNGQIKSEGLISKGMRQGCWYFYYPNQMPNSEEYYLNDELHGKVKSYDFEGRLVSIENYEYGLEQDSAFYYYPGGALKRKGIFKDGLYAGIWLGYHENGRLSQSGAYVLGMPDGLWRFYDSEGLLSHEGMYREAKETGLWKVYHPKGYIQEEGEMDEGNRIGVWRQYNKKGKVVKTRLY